jgi:hypothetical protein
MNTVNEVYERTTISLSKENYEKIRRFGYAGESINDALSRILGHIKIEEVNAQ